MCTQFNYKFLFTFFTYEAVRVLHMAGMPTWAAGTSDRRILQIPENITMGVQSWRRQKVAMKRGVTGVTTPGPGLFRGPEF